MNPTTVLNTLIAQKLVAPTLQGRAFRLVQQDKSGRRAIGTTVVLATDEMTRKEQMRKIKEAVMYYMGVNITFTHYEEDYWTATAPAAITSSRVMDPDFKLDC